MTVEVVYPFGEGKSDEVVFEFLTDKWFPKKKWHKFEVVGGKTNFSSKIKVTIESEIMPERFIGVIAFRDKDFDETTKSILQGFRKIVYDLFSKWLDFRSEREGIEEIKKLEERLIEDVLYKWEFQPTSELPGLRFILHIANDSRLKNLSLKNWTTDGYILSVGLLQNVLNRFSQESKVNSTSEILEELITRKVPDTIKEKGISFEEDKDFLAAYLVSTRFWVVKRTEEKLRLFKIILERGYSYSRSEFEEIFSTWKKAMEEVWQQ